MKWLSRLARRFSFGAHAVRALLFALLFLRITDPAPLEELRLRTFDLFQVIKPRVATQRPVVIVDIDEESLRKLGQWPWPRTRVADLVTQAARGSARGHRLRRHLRRAGPAVAGARRRQLPRSRRGNPRTSCARCRATTRSWPTPSSSRASCSARSGLPVAVPQPDAQPAAAGFAALGGDPKPFLLNFPGLLQQRPGARKGRGRARAVHHPLRARRHRAARADGHEGAGHDRCRR